jgi:hypothetical protein
MKEGSRGKKEGRKDVNEGKREFHCFRDYNIYSFCTFMLQSFFLNLSSPLPPPPRYGWLILEGEKREGERGGAGGA